MCNLGEIIQALSLEIHKIDHLAYTQRQYRKTAAPSLAPLF